MQTNQLTSNSALVQVQGSQVITTSLLIAQKFNKRHADVVRTVKSLILANAKLRSLYESATYVDLQGKSRSMFTMNKDGFVLLVMGFTGEQALSFKLDYINAFNAMEQKLRTPVATTVRPSRESLRASIRRALEEGCKQATDIYTLNWYREQYEKEHRAAERLRLSLTSIARQLQSVGIRPEIG